MKKIFKHMMMLLFLFSVANVMAQDKGTEATGEKKAGTDAGGDPWEKYMAIGEMHKMLASADGEWKAEMEFWTAPGAPSEKSTSTCKNEMILGGRYQQSTMEGTMMGMPFEGRGIVGFDNIRKVFVNTWIDNMGTGLSYSEGPYDAKTKSITFMGETMDPMSGKMIKTRSVYKFESDSHHVFEMYMMQNGKEVKSMAINYKR